MSQHRAALVCLLALAVLVNLWTPADATQLFAADFQDGKTTGWTAVGTGDVRLSTYNGNVSMQLRTGAVAFTSFSAHGYRQVVVTLAFAGEHLGVNGACIADLSVDAGHTWVEAARLNAGEDDGMTLHRNGARIAAATDAKQVLLRVRNVGLDPAARCWADDVLVEATPMLPADRAMAGADVRTALTASALQDAIADGPWPMTAFTPPEDGQLPQQRFEGRLQLLREQPGSTFRVRRDSRGLATADHAAVTHLPPFDFEFIQSGNVLIPVQRGAVRSDHREWEYILEPGRVWQEAADGAYQRVSLPFTLEERNANCMHNGVLTFLFRADGAVTDVAYEIAKETCAYFQFDAWGYFATRYIPGPVTDREAVLAQYQEEGAHHLPTRPMAALAADHPGADPNRFGSPSEVPADSMTMYGVTLEGVNYVGGCETRFGPYPYCDALDLPSYSLAKSLVGALLSLRMAMLYPDVLNSRISRFVPECTPSAHWDQVTFREALDMATGHFTSRAFEADEDGADFQIFQRFEDHAGRIDFACTHYPQKAAPGTVWVYHTTDSYLLGTALNAYYRSQQGSGVDLFTDLWLPQFWLPLHLSPAVAITRRTRDAAAQPFTGYGLTLLREDVAKLADFINADRGRVAGEQKLEPQLLGEAMQRDPAHPGLVAEKDTRYQHGFWAWNAQATLGCHDPTWIPFLSGYGGITVALIPNGMNYYYFRDGGVFSWARAVAEANRIRPFCQPTH